MNDKKETKILKSSTAYIIYNPGIQLYDLIDECSTSVYKTQEKKPLAYTYDPEKEIIRVPAGLGDSYITSLFPGVKIEILKYQPFKPTDFTMVSTPDKYQKKVLGDIVSTLKKDSQVKCTLPTGTGKTFTATFLISILKMKTLVVVGTDNLRQQWQGSFLKHSTLRQKDILVMEGASAFAYNYPNKQIFITTHHTIRSLLNPDNPASVRRFNEWLVNNGIGIKIFDEADLETLNMFKLDLTTNVCRTMYLTATDYKSSRYDDEVYQRCFQVTKAYGAEQFIGMKPNRAGFIILHNTKPGKALYTRPMSFSNDFSPVKYCEYLFMYRLDFVMEWCDEAKKVWDDIAKVKYNPDARLLITVSRKHYCFILRDMLMERWGLEYKDIGVFNSAVDPKWKDNEFKKKIVISTLKSFGRGVDSENMDVHLDFEVYISGSQFSQAVGRTGRKGGSKGFYITAFDLAYTFIQISYKKKKEYLETLFESYKIVEKNYDYEVVARDEAVKMRKQFQVKWWKYLKNEKDERMTAKKKYSKGDE